MKWFPPLPIRHSNAGTEHQVCVCVWPLLLFIPYWSHSMSEHATISTHDVGSKKWSCRSWRPHATTSSHWRRTRRVNLTTFTIVLYFVFLFLSMLIFGLTCSKWMLWYTKCLCLLFWWVLCVDYVRRTLSREWVFRWAPLVQDPIWLVVIIKYCIVFYCII